MRTINLNVPAFHEYTAIQNAFIDNYLPHANPTFSVVYLYFYRHSLSGTCAITTAAAAETFGILESDVINSLKYWEKNGLLRLSGSGDDYSIEFLYLSASTQPVETPAPKPAAVIQTRPVYTIDELELYKCESTEVSRLFSLAEQAFGKLLHYNDLNMLFGIYDWLRLPLEVIERLIEYCAENERLNMRYIEKVAMDWTERGINTLDSANEYIRTMSSDYREIQQALGRGGRSLTASEMKYMDKWLRELAMPLPVVLEACDRTIMHAGKGTLSYCDKVITEWHKKGVNSLEEAARVSAEFSAKAKPVTSNAKPTRFANFKQREWDFEKIERAERAYLEATEKGLAQ